MIAKGNAETTWKYYVYDHQAGSHSHRYEVEKTTQSKRTTSTTMLGYRYCPYRFWLTVWPKYQWHSMHTRHTHILPIAKTNIHWCCHFVNNATQKINSTSSSSIWNCQICVVRKSGRRPQWQSWNKINWNDIARTHMVNHKAALVRARE